MEWYYANQGEQRGPVSESEFEALVEKGEVKPDTVVWREGMEDWVEYRTLIEAAAEAPVSEEKSLEKPAVQSATPDEEPLSGNTPNGELTAMARKSLEGQWGNAIGVYVIMVIILNAAAAFYLPYFFIAGPVYTGLSICFLSIACGREMEIEELFHGFKIYGSTLLVWFLRGLYVFLWSLLFIIPGIIASFAYSQVYFVLAENPEVSASEALRRSRLMMRGRKWKYFCLNLRFFWWIAGATLFTFGIGLFWVLPYMKVAHAQFYRDVAQRDLGRQ